MGTVADRMRQHRARKARGRIVLLVEVDEVALLDTLEAMRIPVGDDDLARGVERLLERLQEKIL
jgi:hypothetical protein